MIINNPMGPDPIFFYDENAAIRLGQRMRKIREFRGLTQAALGSMVGLTGERIQKYEKGVRKPKPELLNKIASALGVSSLSLVDPIVATYIGAMYSFFEMEESYGLKLQRINGQLALVFTDDALHDMNDYLKEWEKELNHINSALKEASSEDDRQSILHSYELWKWNYPKDIADRTDQRLREIRKAKLKKKMEELQQELSELDDEQSNDE